MKIDFKVILLLFLLLVPRTQAETIRETVLGSLPELGAAGVGYTVAASRTNLATVRRDGRFEVVVSLTTTGEKYDRIVRKSLRWVDERLIYIGQRGTNYVLVDGQKKISLPGPLAETGVERPLVTPDGSNYVVFVAERNGIVPWVNGKRARANYDRILFVPQTRRAASELVYAIQKACLQRVIGNKTMEKLEWTVLSGIEATKDAKTVFAWGEIKGRNALAKNGKVILNHNPSQKKFFVDEYGQNWVTLVDHVGSVTSRCELLLNGATVAEVELLSGVSELYLSVTNGVWAWVVPNDDATEAVLKMAQRPDQTIDLYVPNSLQLADDGKRIAWLAETPQRAWVVDGVVIEDEVIPAFFPLKFGPRNSFAYVAQNRERTESWVTTTKGRGKHFAAVSDVEFTRSGTVVYIAREDAKSYFVVDGKMYKLEAENLIFQSLKVKEDGISVIGNRGKQFLEFTFVP